MTSTSKATTTTTSAGTAPAAPTADELAFLTGAKRYRGYSIQVRNTAAWLIGALAAVAAVVFGAGPVLKTPDLDWSTDTLQLILAGVAGLAGLGGVVYLIWTIATVFLPQETTLATLPPTLVEQVNADPSRSLPVGLGLTSVDGFRSALVETRLAVAGATSQTAVAKATAALPGATPADKTRAAAMEAALARPVAALQVMEDFRAELIERGEYLRKNKQWQDLRTPLGIASALAVVGVIGFPLALSTPPADADEGGATSGGAAAVYATTMTQVPGPASDSLWAALSLEACELDGTVPVLLLGGKGTPAEPHKVQTVPTGDCESRTFQVIDDVAVVDLTKPTEATITYQPATRVSDRTGD